MNISGVSNIPFGGVYVVHGSGEDTDRVKYAMGPLVSRARENNENAQINDLGHGYLKDDVPAYFLVTTGDDVKVYNEFAKRWDEYKEIADLEFPDYSGPDDFKNRDEYNEYFARHAASADINMIYQRCDFSNGLKVLDANKVLNAIKEHRFDFESGKIKENQE